MVTTALQKLAAPENLAAVWKDYRPKAKNSASGINGLTPKQFDAEAELHISILSRDVRKGYTLSKLRAVAVPKKDPSKFRIICVPTIQDRIIQRAVLNEIEKKARHLGIINDVSFGFVKESDGVKRGTGGARSIALAHRASKPWAFKADISSFFDRIKREDLSRNFRKAFSLKSLGKLVESAICCEVDDSDPRIKRILSDNGIVAGEGLRQGMPLSPILSNFLLRDFDRGFIQSGIDLVRYADDLLAFASSEEECNAIKDYADTELKKLGLNLSPEKTGICAPDQAVEFLGLELGLRPGTDKYALTISGKQISKIKEEFGLLHDLDYVLSKSLNAHKLSKRLDNMVHGYSAAYGVADNYRELESTLAQCRQNCFLKIYGGIFGPGAVSKLTKRQREFLML